MSGRECGRWRWGVASRVGSGELFDVERERRVEHGSERDACRMPTVACRSVPVIPSRRAHPHLRGLAGRCVLRTRPRRAGSGPVRATSGRVATTPELGDARLRARRRSAPRVRELTVGAPELHGHQQCGHGLPPSVADVAFAEWTSGTSSTCGALQVASKRRRPSGEALATGRVADATVDGVGAASSAFRLERTPLREARAYRAFDVTLAQNAQRKRRPLKMPVLAIGGAASWGNRVGEAMKRSRTKCRAWSSPAPATGSPRRRPRRCWRR